MRHETAGHKCCHKLATVQGYRNAAMLRHARKVWYWGPGRAATLAADIHSGVLLWSQAGMLCDTSTVATLYDQIRWPQLPLVPILYCCTSLTAA